MRSGPILAFAALCGAGAFVWMLRPKPQPPRPAPFREPIRTRTDAERAVLARPDGFVEWYTLATFYQSGAEAQRAWRESAHAAEAVANTQSPMSARALFYLAWAREKLGDAGGARASFEAAAKLYEEGLSPTGGFNGRYQAWMRLAWCRQKLGQPAQAKDAWETALEIIDRTQPGELPVNMLYDRACCEAQRGDAAQAVWSLERATEKGFKDYRWAEVDDHLRPISANQGFMEWLARGTGEGTGGGK